MVKITQKYLIKHSSNLKLFPTRHKNESDTNFLKRITHLKLQGRYIDTIDLLKDCQNVTTIYLQNNLLQSIKNLDNFQKLTHLHMQRNKIGKIENLDCLINLKKLYLGYNEIAVFEGLENLKTIKEVHIENQNLPLGESLYFDPITIASLSTCLEVLNVSGNGLTTLFPIMNLMKLRELKVNENKLQDLEDIAEALPSWPNLTRIDLEGNPVTSQRNFKDVVILNGKNLRYVDRTEIKPTTRNFIEGWKRRSRSQAAQVEKISSSSKGSPARKEVHFKQILRAELPLANEEHSATIPLSFQPWKLRENLILPSGLHNLRTQSMHRLQPK